ncbi:MAG: VanZ family protein [Bacteroidales bacterium]|nr:VanZ family protein [Bacteroidales bacterium]
MRKCVHLKNWLPAIAWALFVLILTTVPGKYFPKVTRFIDWLSPDKVVHLLMFGILAFLTAFPFQKPFTEQKRRSSISFFVILSGAAYGGLTELLQAYVFIGRSGNLYDFLADVVGTLIGFGVFWLWHKKKYPGAKLSIE